LTANLQLRSLPQPSRDPRRVALGGGPRPGPRPRPFTRAARRSPGGAAIDGSSAPNLPPAALATAGQACDTTSDVPRAPSADPAFQGTLARPPRDAASPSPRVAGPGRDAVSSKTVARSAPGRLPSPSAPSPEHARRVRWCACAGARGINRSPPPVSLLACRWLSPPRPGFRRAFARGARPHTRGASELDPSPFGLDRAPLVDFRNQFDPRARPPTARSTRTPLVARPSPRWLETPARQRSHLTSPPCEGQGPCTLHVSLARTHPGPRATSPVLPRRRAGFASPRCLPPMNRTRCCGGAEASSQAVRAERTARGPGFPTGCYQPVGNTRRLLTIPATAALDGAAGTRSSGDATEA